MRGALPVPRTVIGPARELVGQVHRRELARDIAGPRHHGGVVVDPSAQKAVMVDAALVAEVAVDVGGAVARADASEMRRLLRGGVILAPAPVGIADHPHIAVAPRLRGDPFDQIVAVVLLVRVEEIPLSLRKPRAPRLGDDVHIAFRHIEAGGAGLDRVTPVRRLLLDVLRIGRHRQQRRITASRDRAIDIDREPDAVEHRHGNALIEHRAGWRLRRAHQLARVGQCDVGFGFRHPRPLHAMARRRLPCGEDMRIRRA
jgi:hypothetical protein